jgi:hypothetical protein
LVFPAKRVKRKKRNVNSSKSSKPVFYRFFMRINNRRIFYRFGFTTYRINWKWKKGKEEKAGVT